jgi:hypothetical protein
MISQTQRETLCQFFGGYFHEDWPLDAESPDEIVSAFVRGRADDDDRHLAQLSSSILAFLDDQPSDDELERALFRQALRPD